MGDGDPTTRRTFDIGQPQAMPALPAPDPDGHTKHQVALMYRDNTPNGIPSVWVRIFPDWPVFTFNIAGRGHTPL